MRCSNSGVVPILTNPEYPPPQNGLLIEKLDKIRLMCVDTCQSGNYFPHLAMLCLQFSTLHVNQPLHPLIFLCEHMYLYNGQQNFQAC